MLQHSKRAHPNIDPVVVPVPTPSNPTIKPITRKRKYPKSPTNTPTNSNINEEIPMKMPVIERVGSIKEPAGNDEMEVEDAFAFTEVDEEERQEAIVFICNYCPKRCNNEPEMKVHWELTHKSRQLLFKYKRMMRTQITKKGTINYKCSHCHFIGHLEPIKKHFKLKHPDLNFWVFRYKCGYCDEYFRNVETIRVHCKRKHDDAELLYSNIEVSNEDSKEVQKPKDFVCEYCDAEFDIRSDIIDHHKALHSHLELNLPPDLTPQKIIQQEEVVEELKTYMCPQCSHTSNSYAAMRDHLRGHAKPFECSYCPLRFTYPSLVKNHQTKEHPNLEHKYKTIEEACKLNEDLRKSLLKLTENGIYEKMSGIKCVKRLRCDQGNQPNKIRIIENDFELEKSAPVIDTPADTVVIKPIKQKQTARKSTTHFVQDSEGYSYYGSKPDLTGLDNVKTTVTFMDSLVTMHIAQFRGFLDICPIVPVADCMQNKNQL